MTKAEMIITCDKLASCLETQVASSWTCHDRDGCCDGCPYDIPTPAEAAVAIRALLSEIRDMDKRSVRISFR